MKLFISAGARPNFIKIAPIIRAIDEHNACEKRESIEYLLVHTGQHYDYEMSKIFFKDLNIPEPDIHLDIGSGTHAEQTGTVMIRFEKLLMEHKPNLVMVVGDVNSTLGSALAAVKIHIPIAHIEAGLRSYDKSMPEEINRILTDHCSLLLFCPTENAINNLNKEGITKWVYLTGDVTVDVLISNKPVADKSDVLERLGLKRGHYLLTTIHRPINTDDLDNLKSILAALSESGERVVFPVHPRTRIALHRHGVGLQYKNIMFIDPLGYIDFLKLMANARKISTDSGGIQKEAYLLGVPCITLREKTEWVETIENGWNILVGADKKKILGAIKHFEPMGERPDIFGNGAAATNICDIIMQSPLV